MEFVERFGRRLSFRIRVKKRVGRALCVPLQPFVIFRHRRWRRTKNYLNERLLFSTQITLTQTSEKENMITISKNSTIRLTRTVSN